MHNSGLLESNQAKPKRPTIPPISKSGPNYTIRTEQQVPESSTGIHQSVQPYIQEIRPPCSSKPRIESLQTMNREHSQLLPELGRVLGSPESIDLPSERADGGVDLEYAGRDGLRRVLLAADEMAPPGFQILKAHPSRFDLTLSPRETETETTTTRTRTATRAAAAAAALCAESGGDYGRANRSEGSEDDGGGEREIGRRRLGARARRWEKMGKALFDWRLAVGFPISCLVGVVVTLSNCLHRHVNGASFWGSVQRDRACLCLALSCLCLLLLTSSLHHRTSRLANCKSNFSFIMKWFSFLSVTFDLWNFAFFFFFLPVFTPCENSFSCLSKGGSIADSLLPLNTQ